MPHDNSWEGEQRDKTPTATWKREVFPVLVNVGSGPETRHITGYVNGLFALDCRGFRDENLNLRSGWVITHLPTGFALRGIKANFQKAKQIAARFAAAADWDFSDPEQAKERGAPAKAIMAEFPACSSLNDFCAADYVEVQP